MANHSLFVSFPARGWRGPPLMQWEPALLEEDRLAIKAEKGGEGDEEAWLTCALGDIQRVRYCSLSQDKSYPCCHAEVTIKTAGRLYAYASRECLRYLQGRGISVTELDREEAAAGRALWRELSRTDETLPAAVCDLVSA